VKVITRQGSAYWTETGRKEVVSFVSWGYPNGSWARDGCL
jgi:hypothetical protein